MSGVRLYHPLARATTLRLLHQGGLEPDGRLRAAKHYHLPIDADGYATVTAKVWQRVQQAEARGQLYDGHRFVLVGDVAKPPPQGVGGAATPGTYTDLRSDGLHDSTALVHAARLAGTSIVAPDVAG